MIFLIDNQIKVEVAMQMLIFLNKIGTQKYLSFSWILMQLVVFSLSTWCDSITCAPPLSKDALTIKEHD
jgi:hypothetical protein